MMQGIDPAMGLEDGDMADISDHERDVENLKESKENTMDMFGDFEEKGHLELGMDDFMPEKKKVYVTKPYRPKRYSTKKP